MNLAAVALLATRPETRTWYRAIDPAYFPTALATAHSRQIPSRFNAGPSASPMFEILYLAENHVVALFEAQAMFGSPATPGGMIANPARPWIVLNVRVSLQAITDLTDVLNTQMPLATTAQELTGDWRGYAQRGFHTSIPNPVGVAPTQELGAALHADRRIEGFLSLSARIPYHLILAIFPTKLRPGSSVVFAHRNAAGTVLQHRIP